VNTPLPLSRESAPRSGGRVRVFFFRGVARLRVRKKKTLTQPSPAKAGEG